MLVAWSDSTDGLWRTRGAVMINNDGALDLAGRLPLLVARRV
jgi:hypothetical protein